MLGGFVVWFLVTIASVFLISRNYIKVPPNQAAIISGRRRKLDDGTIVGYRLVWGGATLVMPFLEKVDYLNLNVITIPFAASGANTTEGVSVSVEAVAKVKIKADDQSIRAAAERFLGLTADEFQSLVYQILEGRLREILGTLTSENTFMDRQSLSLKLTVKAAADLEKMGIGLDALVIQEISESLPD